MIQSEHKMKINDKGVGTKRGKLFRFPHESYRWLGKGGKKYKLRTFSFVTDIVFIEISNMGFYTTQSGTLYKRHQFYFHP